MSARILVAYDGSEQSRYALTYAVNTYEAAEIVLLHVIEPFVDYTGTTGYSSHEQQTENAKALLENARADYDTDRIETVIQYGRPIHRIVRYIQESGIDHVVIGSHGRDGAARLLLGSVAETVARRSPVPVTVVRRPPDGFETPEHVVVPFDGSTQARNALAYALDQFEEADVTALYAIYPPAEEPIDVDPDTPFDEIEDWEKQQHDHASTVLEIAREVASDRDHTVRTKGLDGKPVDVVVEYVESEDADHVVIGSTGRDGLSRLLLGSVAETVVRRSPVSVTVAK